LEKPMWDLKQNPSSIAAVFLSSAGSSMIQVKQNRQSLFNNFVRSLPFHLHNEADAAGIMFKLGIIQTLLSWRGIAVHFLSFRVTNK
jgi:hypothetical protein